MVKKVNDILIELAQSYSKKTVECLREQIVSIILFGSVARGEANNQSDIDLYIVLDTPLSGVRRLRQLFSQIDKAFETQIVDLTDLNIFTRFSLNIKKKEQAVGFKMLYLDMADNSLILYDKDAFMENILNETKILIKKWGSKKVVCGKTYYWELQPGKKELKLFQL